jgi:LDH2 family malate/lactate/ureidoglycolate dehydrogenase
MAIVDGGIYYAHEALRDWAREIFIRAGVREQDAGLLTDSLIKANLRGVDTHGLTHMLITYVRRIRAEVVNVNTRFDVLREKPSTALIDCHNSLGQIGADFAMRMAIEKAKTTGMAFVGLTRSNHYGAAAIWAMMALEHDMIGFSCVNAPAVVAPTGGRLPMFGTNPLAVAVPTGTDIPFVLDMATTVVARGRIGLFAKQNRPLEPGWAFDDHGRPTTDAAAAMKGLLAPLGGYKGYGIAFAIDILSGIMTGSNYGVHFPGFLADNLVEPWNVGGIFAAIDIDSFMDVKAFTDRMQKACDEVRNCEKADGVDRVYIPGEIEYYTAVERKKTGIPLPPQVAKDFGALGEEMGLPFPKP